MRVKELLEEGANVSISVSMADLREVIRNMQDEWQSERDQMEAQREQDNQLLSANQVVVMLGVTKPTLWRWNNNGYLKNVKVGVKVRYRRGDVERILNEQQKDRGGAR